MTLRSGPLRHVISFQQRSNSQDTVGQPLPTWSNVYTGIRAEIDQLSGRELYAASEKLAEANTKISLRYLPGLSQFLRIVHDGPNCCGGSYTIYDIGSIDDIEQRHEELRLICKSGLTEG